MKNLWLRVGMEVEITDKEYEELKAANSNGDYRKLANLFYKMIACGIPSGESYIVPQEYMPGDDYDNPQKEIGVYL